ncbi:MAG: MarR family winged helix-turn-helix transcriptional regulator [Clostridia bacterium]
MQVRTLGARLMMLNVLRRNLVFQKTIGYELHHGQLPLLEFILMNPGCTQQDIASQLKVTPASIAQSTTRLQKVGLIQKRVDPNNKRKNRLLSTDAGMHAASLYRQSFDEVDAATFAGLSSEEFDQLAVLLDRMIQNLNVEGTGIIPCPFWKGEPPK